MNTWRKGFRDKIQPMSKKLKHPEAVYSDFGNFLARALEVARQKIEEYNLFLGNFVRNTMGAKAFNQFLDVEQTILEKVGWEIFFGIAILVAAGAIAYYGGITALIIANPILAAIFLAITGGAVFIIYKNRKFVLASKDIGVRYKKDFDALLATYPEIESRIEKIDELLHKCVESLLFEAFRISMEEFRRKTAEEKKAMLEEYSMGIDFDIPSSFTSDQLNGLAKRIFLCHSSDDKPIVKKLYQSLLKAGFRPWLDEYDIVPGQEFDLAIKKAISETDFFLVCLSKNAVDKSGYVQKEIKIGLDMLDEMPDNRIFLVPIRLNECNVPARLSAIQWVDLFGQNGMEKLIKALSTQ